MSVSSPSNIPELNVGEVSAHITVMLEEAVVLRSSHREFTLMVRLGVADIVARFWKD